MKAKAAPADSTPPGPFRRWLRLQTAALDQTWFDRKMAELKAELEKLRRRRVD